MIRAVVLLALFASPSCDQQPDVPRDGDGTCESAHATLVRLGGCGLDMEHYIEHCHSRETAEAKIAVKSAETCITKSGACAAALRCK
jgi:hypothetical protein